MPCTKQGLMHKISHLSVVYKELDNRQICARALWASASLEFISLHTLRGKPVLSSQSTNRAQNSATGKSSVPRCATIQNQATRPPYSAPPCRRAVLRLCCAVASPSPRPASVSASLRRRPLPLVTPNWSPRLLDGPCLRAGLYSCNLVRTLQICKVFPKCFVLVLQ